MVKVGLLIDRYHLELKVRKFLKYLKSKAAVEIYLEEETLLTPSNLSFDEDLFFVKTKTPIILNLIKLIEDSFPSIKVINSFRGIFNAIHRFMNSFLLQNAGISVPEFTLNPEGSACLFEDYIIKNIIDQKNYSFNPQIEKIDGHLIVRDKRALAEAKGGKEKYSYLYYQKFIKSKWEYKVYGFGEELFFYRQLPVLINPDKMKSREKINEIPELREMVLKAMHVLDLKVVSIDILESKEKYYITDVNSTPNFNYIKNGHEVIADYLIKEAKQ